MGIKIDKDTAKELLQYGKYLLNKTPLPENQFIIFAEGRSGSTLLVNLLNSSGQIHCDLEILNRSPVLFPYLYLKTMAARSTKLVYGFKLLDYQLKKVQHIKNPEELLHKLHDCGYKFIYLTRRNKLFHALSKINAIQKNKFHHRISDGENSYKRITVDVDQLIKTIDITETNTNLYQTYLAEIPHLSLSYEENLQYEELHQQTADEILNFLELTPSPVSADLIKVMPSNLQEIVENPEEIINAISQTKYACFLETNSLT